MTRYYILNTNTKHFTEDDRDMLQEQKAAAYYAPYKNKIENLHEGDVVFLYRSGMGIVAVGKASGQVIKRDYHGDSALYDEEWLQRLSDFKHMMQPVTAKQIRSVTQTYPPFLRFLFALREDQGRRLYDYVIGQAREEQSGTRNNSAPSASRIIEDLGDEMDIMREPQKSAWKAYLTFPAYAKVKAAGYIYEKDGYEYIKVWDNHNIPFIIHMRLAGIDNAMENGSSSPFGNRRAIDETRSVAA